MILRLTLAGAFLLTLLPQQAFAQVVDTYEYDELGRLRVVDSDGTNNANDTTRSWCYDEQGNRIRYEAKGLGVEVPCADPPSQTLPGEQDPDPPSQPSSNTPPSATDDNANGPCNMSASVNLTANDSDMEDNPAKPVLVSISGPTGGGATAYVISASSVRVEFGPQSDYSQFTYTIRDTQGATDSGTLTVWTSSCNGQFVL